VSAAVHALLGATWLPPGAAALHATGLSRLAERPRVAIVIPIYADDPSLAVCLESLEPTAAREQVVLVDDSSGDPRVRRACTSFAERFPSTVVVVNERNVGFVGSVNAGIAAAAEDRDVVLLNSDTAITAHWLEKLSAAAYMTPDVASVSPLSNAADIFSLPEDRTNNPLPPGWRAETCARVLERIAPRMYETIPATSGFCQYIRRAAIDEVGVFDDQLFHRGYGEDNDFCERARAAGFVHVIDDATFIYHERSVSFGTHREQLSRVNKAILKALHPGHVQASLAWERESRLEEVRGLYRDALDLLGDTPPAVIERALGDGGSRMVVTRLDNGHGPQPAPRTVTLALHGSGAEVDLWGQGRLSVPADVPPVGLASWLVNRWRVRELAIVGEALDATDRGRLRDAWGLAEAPQDALRQ
jgi:GT2 family glycosyltransferase